MRRSARLLAVAAFVAAALPTAPVGAVPVLDEAHSSNMAHVANVQWGSDLRRGDGRIIDVQGGTDVEFASIDGRDYAFAGSYRNGLQVVDVTDPVEPALVTTYDCRILQGDVQTFTRDGRWYVTYTADSGYTHRQSRCYDDAGYVVGQSGNGQGTLIIDVTVPSMPRTVSFVPIVGGSHNQTVHPSGDYLYNSNSGSSGVVEVVDIRDLTAPRIVERLQLMPGAAQPADAHDVTFSADGSRAYAAAVGYGTVIVDTTDPANPEVVSEIIDPAITLHHQADPVTVDGRTFVVINDELNGAGGNEVCPGGGLHVWDVTDEAAPTKVGAWFAPEVTVREGAPTGLPHGTQGFPDGTVSCTSHVFRIYPEQGLLVIAWFGAGVRVLDLSELGATSPVGGGVAGTTLTPGLREVGFFRFVDTSDAWAAKVLRFEEDGSAYIVANDQTRGLDVFRYDATAAASSEPGTWLTPAQALQRASARRADDAGARLAPVPDLRGDRPTT